MILGRLRLIRMWTIIGGALLVCTARGHAQTSSPTNLPLAYIVHAGDTVVTIARRFGITVEALDQANGLRSTKIRIGQKLFIPTSQASTILTNKTPRPGISSQGDHRVMKIIDPELQALVENITTNWNAGRTNTADIEKYIRGFDDLLSRHPGEKMEAVAQILYAEEDFYFGALGDGDIGSQLLHQLVRDYPDTKLGQDMGQILKRGQPEDGPTPALLIGNPWKAPDHGGLTLSPSRAYILDNGCVLTPLNSSGQTNLIVAVPGLDRTQEHLGAFSSDLKYRPKFPRLSLDGSRLATLVNSNIVQLLDAATRQPVGAPLKHLARVIRGEFSPDNLILATISDDGLVQLWHSRDGGRMCDPIVQKETPVEIFFSGDSSRLCLAASNSMVSVWEVLTGRQVGKPFKCCAENWQEAHESSGAWTVLSPDGRTLLDGNTPYWLWNVETGTRSANPIQTEDKTFAVVFSPDSQRVVTTAGANERSSRVWDAHTGRPLTKPLHHRHSVFTAQFFPDGRRFVTTSLDGAARIWDSTNGKLLSVFNHPGAEVPTAALSPDGMYLVTLGGATARIWSTETGQMLAEPLESGPEISQAMFSTDSKALITITTTQFVQTWDILK